MSRPKKEELRHRLHEEEVKHEDEAFADELIECYDEMEHIDDLREESEHKAAHNHLLDRLALKKHDPRKHPPSLFWAPIVQKAEDRVEDMMGDMRKMIASFGEKHTPEQTASLMCDEKGLPVRREQIHGDTALEDDETDHLVVKVMPKTEETKFHLRDILKQHFLFCRMSHEELENVIDAMEERFVEPEEVIIQQGEDFATHFFVMITGACAVEVHGKLVAYMVKKCAFGELALMYNTPRAATIRAKRVCEIWTLERDFFRKALISSSRMLLVKIKHFLQGISLFRDSNYSEATLTLLARSLFRVNFSDNHYIIRQGDEGEEFYLLYEGTVRVTKLTDEGTEVELIKLHKGAVFGERALIKNDVRAANVISHGPTTCFALRRAEFNAMLGDLRERMNQLNHHRLWRSASAFKHLHDKALAKLEKLSSKVLKLFAGQELKGNLGAETMYLVLEGSVENNMMDIFKTGSVIGTVENGMALVGDNLKCTTEEAQLVQISRQDVVDLATMSHSDSVDAFDEYGDGNSPTVLDVSVVGGSENSREGLRDEGHELVGDDGLEDDAPSSPRVRVTPSRRGMKQSIYGDPVDGGGNINDDAFNDTGVPQFEMLRHNVVGKLGVGTFSSNFVLSGPSQSDPDMSKELYVMKAVNLTKLTPSARNFYERELEALSELSGFYFISNFYGKLEVKDRVALKLEMFPAGDLFGYLYGQNSVLRAKGSAGGLPLKTATLFAANILVTIEFIHGRGFVYRDLKPENFHFDSKGFLILSDFGLSKKIPYKDHKGTLHRRTYTLCGTPDYMAPEIVLTQGHDKGADLWAFGVLLYEMLCGLPPFSDKNKQRVFEKIVHADKYLVLPHTMDSHAKSLVRGLLHPNPVLRVGTLQNGCEAVRQVPLFQVMDIDWVALESCDSSTPFIPPPPLSLEEQQRVFRAPSNEDFEDILLFTARD